MQGTGWPAEATGLTQDYGGPALPEKLQRVARGEATLADALLTLAHYSGEQALTAADLLERETWALTAILERSVPLWRHLPNPTLRFVPDPSAEPRLELGSFAHLAALIAPSADEQALIAATTPCWARVSSASERQRAAQTGALACAYVAISAAEAVATLGLGRILTQIEIATRAAGQAVVAQAQAQRERQAQLSRAERMLGVEPEPPVALLDRSKAVHTCLVLFLLGSTGIRRLALGGAFWALVVLLACLFFSIPQPMLVLLLGIGLAPVSLYLGARSVSRSDGSEP